MSWWSWFSSLKLQISPVETCWKHESFPMSEMIFMRFHGCDGCDLGILGLYPLIFGRNQIAFWLASGCAGCLSHQRSVMKSEENMGDSDYIFFTLSRKFSWWNSGVFSQCDHHRPIESHWGMVFFFVPLNMFPTSHVWWVGVTVRITLANCAWMLGRVNPTWFQA